jgi:hypothetical protein
MKRYIVQIPREQKFNFTVVGRDINEARFEGIKQMIKDILDQKVSFEIDQGDEVYQCEMCAQWFYLSDLTNVEEKQVCSICAPYARGEVPEIW